MIDLPSGTVTFLFTDIEGSTTLAQQYPGDLPALLARHHAILQQAIQAHHGHVFQIIGDAFCAAFHVPGDAVRAAVEAQHALHTEAWGQAAIRVRMGICTGEAEAVGQDGPQQRDDRCRKEKDGGGCGDEDQDQRLEGTREGRHHAHRPAHGFGRMAVVAGALVCQARI